MSCYGLYMHYISSRKKELKIYSWNIRGLNQITLRQQLSHQKEDEKEKKCEHGDNKLNEKAQNNVAEHTLTLDQDDNLSYYNENDFPNIKPFIIETAMARGSNNVIEKESVMSAAAAYFQQSSIDESKNVGDGT